jgi:hypothetical protein
MKNIVELATTVALTATVAAGASTGNVAARDSSITPVTVKGNGAENLIYDSPKHYSQSDLWNQLSLPVIIASTSEVLIISLVRPKNDQLFC